MTASETDLLVDLVRRKHECLTQLHALGLRQMEYIDASDMTQLLSLLAVKQRLLTDLTRLERGLDPFRRQAPEERHWASAESRRQCAELIEQSQALFDAVLAQEKLGEDRLRRCRDEAAARLHEVHDAGLARGAYAAGRHTQTNQIDISSET